MIETVRPYTQYREYTSTVNNCYFNRFQRLVEPKGRPENEVDNGHIEDDQGEEDRKPGPLVAQGEESPQEGVEEARADAEVVVVLGMVRGMISGVEHDPHLLQVGHPSRTTALGSMTHAVTELSEVCHDHLGRAETQSGGVDQSEQEEVLGEDEGEDEVEVAADLEEGLGVDVVGQVVVPLELETALSDEW